MQIHQWPEEDIIRKKASVIQPYMRASLLPYVIIAEGYLDDAQCDAIIEEMKDVEPYKFKECGAVTRECPWPLPEAFHPVKDLALSFNDWVWKYDLDEEGAAYLQTYEVGGKYQLHTDLTPGQSRKLTAVTLLSDPADYDGGDLMLYFHPKTYQAPRTRGTVVLFQPWMLHEVTEITAGIRRTVNFGFWGPPFV